MKILFLFLIFYSCCLTAQVIYVNQSATGLDNGSDWNNAFTDLQDAIALSQTGDEIWVAEGVYTPVPIGSYNSNSPERSVSFIVSDILIYGGFLGNLSETSLQDRPELDISDMKTVLSGDINLDDTIIGTDENTAHVVLCSGNFIINGFSIRSGYDTYIIATNGAGIRIGSGNGSIVKCSLSDNMAGGAIYIGGEASIIIDRCLFINNHDSNGGAIYSSGESVIIINSIFIDCSSFSAGGAIEALNNTHVSQCIFISNTSNQFSAIWLRDNSRLENSIVINNHSDYRGTISAHSSNSVFNTLIAHNTAGSETAGIYSGSFTMHNSIVRNNTVSALPANIMRSSGANPTILNSNIQLDSQNAWVFNEPSNFDLEPLFVDVSTSDFHLLAGSPCIDFGRLDDESPRTDYDGNPRVGNPDIGPYEYYTGDPVFTISGSVVGLLDANDIIVRATSGSTQADYYCSSAGRFDFTFYSGEYTLTPVKSGYAFSPSETLVTLSDANVSGIVFTMSEAPEKPRNDNDKWYNCSLSPDNFRGQPMNIACILVIFTAGIKRLHRQRKHYAER